MVHVTIVGTGERALTIAQLYSDYNIKINGYILEVTDLDIEAVTSPSIIFHNCTNVTIAPFFESLNRADIIVLAIPSYAIEYFINENYGLLSQNNKIVVDATNPISVQDDLFPTILHNAATLSNKSSIEQQQQNSNGDGVPNNTTTTTNSTIRWVKGLHDITTESMNQYNTVQTKNRIVSTTLCSKYPRALHHVQQFVENSLGLDVKIVPYRHYNKITFAPIDFASII